ncbi:MAG: hypothetical protein KGL74_04445 [Elusimicrobia bacterium]|nr:hypothetical protein [Elusimicrobiota bacterium]MDE2510349.1 hypothetical protein [Elusimicrobiota bacterium]
MKASFFPFVAIIVLAACQKDRIEVRRTPKEELPASAMPVAPRARGVKWTTPPGWKELPGNGMRLATLEPPQKAGKIEATVVALPGDVGGELANVNRWRGQLALTPVGEAQLGDLRATVRSAAGETLVYDFTGAGSKKTRLLAGMIQVSGTTWFFKLMGDEAAVEAAKPAFLKLLAGLKRDAA